MNNKRLSVIVPGYNTREEWWRRCIDSIMKNIGDDDEIICVDDSSSITPNVLREYAEKDNRVRVIWRKTNGGLSIARNAALEEAKGKYVTFVDSDDEILPGTYGKAIETLIRDKSDIVLFGVCSKWVNERLMKTSVSKNRYLGKLSVEMVKELYETSLLNYAWNKVYRKDFIQDHNIWFDANGMPCEDIVFILRCILLGAKWSTIEHTGIIYYRTHGTLLSRYQKSYIEGTSLAASMWARYKESCGDSATILGSIGEFEEKEILKGEWMNIWRRNSPYGLIGKWTFLKNHAEIANGHRYWFFVRTLIFITLRRCFYVRPIQKWHIRRIYPETKPY